MQSLLLAIPDCRILLSKPNDQGLLVKVDHVRFVNASEDLGNFFLFLLHFGVFDLCFIYFLTGLSSFTDWLIQLRINKSILTIDINFS